MFESACLSACPAVCPSMYPSVYKILVSVKGVVGVLTLYLTKNFKTGPN